MSLGAIILMILSLGLCFGGFVYFIVKSLRK